MQASFVDVVTEVHAHQEHLLVLAHFAFRGAQVHKQRNQVFFSWMHLV